MTLMGNLMESTGNINSMKPIESAVSGDALLKSCATCAACAAEKKSKMTAAECQTEREIEPPTYFSQSDLHILNVVPRAMWIGKFDPADTRFVWGNIAALRLWDKPSLAAFTSTDIMSGRSIAIQKTHQKLYQDVQV